MSVEKITSVELMQSENTQIVSHRRPVLFLHLNEKFEPYSIDTEYAEKRLLITWKTELEKITGKEATKLYAYSEPLKKYHLIKGWCAVDILGALAYAEKNLV